MLGMNKKDFKLVNGMAVPILSTYIIQLFFQMGDQAIIGRTNVEGFAAVGIVSAFIYAITGTLGVIGVAYNILAAKSLGEDNVEKFEKLFNTSISTAVLIGVVFEFLSLVFGKYFFMKFYGLSGNTLNYACDYMYIGAIGLGINLLLFIFSAYFKNIRKTRMFVYSASISTLINVSVDYTLVFGKFGFPKLGVKGAAIGTILGLASSLLIYVWGFNKYGTNKFKFKINKVELKDLVKLFLPLSGQDLIESSVFVIFITSIVSRLGVYNIAAYNVLIDLTNFLTFPVYAYAGTALTLVAQCNGKKDMEGIRKYPIISIICSLVCATIFGVLIVLFPDIAGKIITNDSNIIQSVSTFAFCAVLVQLFNLVHQVYKYSLQGISFEKWVLYFSTIVSFSMLPLIYILSVYAKLNLIGVYLGLGLNYIILSIGYIFKYNNFKLKEQ